MHASRRPTPVANDEGMLRLLLALGAPTQVTSRHDGTVPIDAGAKLQLADRAGRTPLRAGAGAGPCADGAAAGRAGAR